MCRLLVEASNRPCVSSLSCGKELYGCRTAWSGAFCVFGVPVCDREGLGVLCFLSQGCLKCHTVLFVLLTSSLTCSAAGGLGLLRVDQVPF